VYIKKREEGGLDNGRRPCCCVSLPPMCGCVKKVEYNRYNGGKMQFVKSVKAFPFKPGLRHREDMP
jgi:hypothetical protein